MRKIPGLPSLKIVYEPRGLAGEYAALAVNLRKGCRHACAYCYCPQIAHMTREAYHAAVTPKKDALVNLERDCAKLAEALGPDCPPIHLEFMSDPYQPDGWTLTRGALGIIKRYGLNFTVLTKGGLEAAEDFDLYGPGDRFGQTVVWASEDARAQYEPGASPILSRSLAAQKAWAKGIYTWLSVEPVCSAFHALRTIAEFADWTSAFKVGPLNHLHLPGLPPVDPLAFVGEAVPLLQDTGRRWMLKTGAFREAALDLALPWWGPQEDEAWRLELRAEPCCKVCGCTEDRACPQGCSWTDVPHVCSACLENAEIAEMEGSLRC